MKNIFPLLALIPTLLFAQTPKVWDGTADDTWYTSNKTAGYYTITTAEQLAGLATLVNGGTNFEGKTIYLDADIALNDTNASGGWRNWNDATTGLKKWTSIGSNYNYCFKGIFSGGVISGLYYNSLFGCIQYAPNTDSAIETLGLVGFYVKGSGMVSRTPNGPAISYSYAIGNVSSENGENVSLIHPSIHIKNSYAIGNVNGEVLNTFYHYDGSTIGTPKTTAEMKQKSTYQGWDFGNVWGIGYPEDKPLNGGMPYLQIQTPLGGAQIIADNGDRVESLELGNIFGRGKILETTYTGSQIKPTPSVRVWELVGTTWNEVEKVAGVDFNYVYGENKNVGIGTFTIIGNKTFWGKREFTFKINKAQVTKPTKLNQNTFNYDGTSKTVTTDISPAASNFIFGGDITKTNAGSYTAIATLKDITNYQWVGGGTQSISFTWTINKVQVTKPTKLNQNTFNYDGTSKTVTTDINPAANNFTFGGTTTNTNAGSYTATATLKDTANYEWVGGGTQPISLTWVIMKAQVPIPQLKQNSFTYDKTAKTVSTDLTPAANNFTFGGTTTSTNAGTYTATATLTNTTNYQWANGTTNVLSLPWTINKATSTDCNVTMSDFTASGTASKPVPSSPNGTYSTSQVTYSYKNQTNTNDLETPNVPANVGVYKVTATFAATTNYEQCTASDIFTITEGDCTPKKIPVSWTSESVFTYNKMVQAPVPSVSEPGVELLRSNAHSAAGIYKGQDAAYAIIKDDAQRCNYALTNNTKDYEIKKKDLKPYFNAPAALSNIESNKDTVWVPHAIFPDPDLLRQILDNLLNYDGFAQDTVTKEKDDASVLRNTPTINVIYANQPPAPKMLSKRVETTQKAVAIVNTDGVSADNYALAKRSITIMEIQDEDTGAKRVLCFRGNYCTELGEDVCSFIKGEKVSNCNNIKRSCRIDTDLCIDNMYISECNSIGGTVIIMSCNEYATPANRPTLASNAFHVWQTASGIVNIDLGYAPSAPVSIQIYNLQGKLIASEQASTRFATIRLNAGSGIYIFKAGTRNAVKIIK